MMRYIKPPDFKSVKEFQAYYQKIEQDINTLLTTDGSAKSAKELNEKLSQALNSAMSYLSKKNQEFTQKELATAFTEGRQAVKEPPKLSAKEAAAILEQQGYRYAKNGLSRDTYIELQNATLAAGKGLKSRVNSIIGDLRKTGQDTVYNVQQAILKDLNEHKVMEVEYSNGAKMPLDAYAAMAARSARIESANIGAIGRALQAGTDYVKMTTMPQCCKLCAAYQDKVYCISGKDKRFPALFKTVLRSGYALPHPNCRHEFIPWFIEMEEPADVEKAIENSKIKYDSKGKLVDVRFQDDIKSYAAWQAGNRQLNREMLEFQRMQEYYAKKEQSAPYKTLGSFRKARRSDNLSPAFKKWRYRRKDEKQYEEWKKIIGEENMPEDVDKFGDLKYNKDKKSEFEFLQHYKYAREEGDVSALVNFKLYKQGKKHLENRFIGQTTISGTEIKSVSNHFLDRHFGTIYRKGPRDPKHEGVAIEELENVIRNGSFGEIKTDKKGRKSQNIFIEDVCIVTINPDTGELIQCNKISK